MSILLHSYRSIVLPKQPRNDPHAQHMPHETCMARVIVPPGPPAELRDLTCLTSLFSCFSCASSFRFCSMVHPLAEMDSSAVESPCMVSHRPVD